MKNHDKEQDTYNCANSEHGPVRRTPLAANYELSCQLRNLSVTLVDLLVVRHIWMAFGFSVTAAIRKVTRLDSEYLFH